MSSPSTSNPPPLPSNVGSVDLESVLNVRRRTLTSIGEKSLSPQQQYRYTDTIYVKREDESNSAYSIDSKILIFGELHFLCGIFERYTSNITVYDDSIEPNFNLTNFSTTAEENEDADTSELDSKLRRTSISSQSPSTTPKTSNSPVTRRRRLSVIGRSQTVGSAPTNYSSQNLEGKRYGCIEISNMSIIEILEILLRNGLELVSEESDYNSENILHQSFVFSKIRQILQKPTPVYNSRSSSFIGT
ncbi:unnamed protein product [Adineta steineri]|uniref:Uncharacterized protein n=1 Tax=Adineta steineri TaxID=433720 RepID=A0A813P9K5_9BILA|nr:unnamed protein product [Adineta steineri]